MSATQALALHRLVAAYNVQVEINGSVSAKREGDLEATLLRLVGG